MPPIPRVLLGGSHGVTCFSWQASCEPCNRLFRIQILSQSASLSHSRVIRVRARISAEFFLSLHFIIFIPEQSVFTISMNTAPRAAL